MSKNLPLIQKSLEKNPARNSTRVIKNIILKDILLRLAHGKCCLARYWRGWRLIQLVNEMNDAIAAE